GTVGQPGEDRDSLEPRSQERPDGEHPREEATRLRAASRCYERASPGCTIATGPRLRLRGARHAYERGRSLVPVTDVHPSGQLHARETVGHLPRGDDGVPQWFSHSAL